MPRSKEIINKDGPEFIHFRVSGLWDWFLNATVDRDGLTKEKIDEINAERKKTHGNGYTS